MNIGVLGGTFDPVHIGHLIIAEDVRVKLGLAGVVFLPAGQPWLKDDRSISPARHRVEMLRLAISSNPYFSLSRIEVDRPGPSYSIDTLPQLKQQLGSDVALYFILGSDALAEFARWKDPQRLMQMCELVIAPRPGPKPVLKALEKAIPCISQHITSLDTPEIGVSSSDIRQRVRRGLSIRYLVPEAVEAYIDQKKLYAD
ncbi:MAG: nicotinate-nucleotide adenylyltransferase [Dehalococcoidia bacterium]|nr:nicotinate-nucleotide adenylyltransferase [Dehalococcoidia bacterium]